MEWPGYPTAVIGEAPRPQVPLHFGRPLPEQRLFAEGAPAVASHYGVIVLTGPDRLSWLHSLSTQDLTALPPGESTETLILSPHGHIEHWFHLVDDGEATWLSGPADPAPAIAFLESMRFMMRVEIADATAQWAVLLSTRELGPQWRPGTVWTDPWPGVSAGGASYTLPGAEHPGAGYRRYETLVPRELLAEVAKTGLLDGQPVEFAGYDAAEALRIEAWRPSPEAEVDHRTLVGEIDALRTAVHLNKGCYRGQEAVARVHNLGQPPRRLVFLHLDGSGHTLPPAGTEITATVRGSRRAVGQVTSSAIHYELGPVALGLIKRSVAPDEELRLVLDDGEEIAAAQEEIVAHERERGVAAPPRHRDLFRR
jgi:folate-binding protein YgfZ